jgi:NAD-dependent SIR2 family protein deacetylase
VMAGSKALYLCAHCDQIYQKVEIPGEDDKVIIGMCPECENVFMNGTGENNPLGILKAGKMRPINKAVQNGK